MSSLAAQCLGADGQTACTRCDALLLLMPVLLPPSAALLHLKHGLRQAPGSAMQAVSYSHSDSCDTHAACLSCVPTVVPTFFWFLIDLDGIYVFFMQAVEAKEGLEIQNESVTLASVSYQAFFRGFPKLAGGDACVRVTDFATGATRNLSFSHLQCSHSLLSSILCFGIVHLSRALSRRGLMLQDPNSKKSCVFPGMLSPHAGTYAAKAHPFYSQRTPALMPFILFHLEKMNTTSLQA